MNNSKNTPTPNQWHPDFDLLVANFTAKCLSNNVPADFIAPMRSNLIDAIKAAPGIVRAVNMHEELLEMNARMERLLGQMHNDLRSGYMDVPAERKAHYLSEIKSLALLKKATE